MTSEEVQKKLVDIFMLEVVRGKNREDFSRKYCIRSRLNLVYLEALGLIGRLSNPEVLNSIDTLLKNKPELQEEWEAMELSDILRRNLVVDGQFIPIESTSFKDALTKVDHIKHEEKNHGTNPR